VRTSDCHQKNNGDTKGVIKSGKSLKDGQHHGEEDNILHNITQKSKDSITGLTIILSLYQW